MAKNLPVLFPDLELTKTKMTQVVKKASDDELHSTLSKIKEFATMFTDTAKEEFITRIKRFKDKFPEEKFETIMGVISLVSRANFKFKKNGEEKLREIMADNNIDEGRLFDINYTVVTSNESALKVMLEKGVIVRSPKINWKKVEEVAKEYPQILKLIENEPTEYLKGL